MENKTKSVKFYEGTSETAWWNLRTIQETSLEAKKSMREPSKAIRESVYEEISENGGCTCDEIEQILELSHQTASARIRELAKAGKVSDGGERRLTRSGRRAIVWVSE